MVGFEQRDARGRVREETRVAIDRIDLESQAREHARMPARARCHVEHRAAGSNRARPALDPRRGIDRLIHVSMIALGYYFPFHGHAKDTRPDESLEGRRAGDCRAALLAGIAFAGTLWLGGTQARARRRRSRGARALHEGCGGRAPRQVSLRVARLQANANAPSGRGIVFIDNSQGMRVKSPNITRGRGRRSRRVRGRRLGARHSPRRESARTRALHHAERGLQPA